MSWKPTRWICMGPVAAIVGGGAVCSADVERYKIRADYVARLNELGLERIAEGFESSAWDGTRYTIADPRFELEVLSQNILWEPAAKDVFGDTWSNRTHGLSTNNNWARNGSWGLFENHHGEPYPTTLRVSAAEPIYAVGGWFNTNPDGQSVGFLFEGRTYANEPGYVLPGYGAMYPGDNPSFGFEFVGIVDPDGFDSVVLVGTLEVNDKGVLEGGAIYGCDDFRIGIAPGFGACDNPADLAPPVDVLDLADINAFVAGFTSQVPVADLDGNGVFDLNDISLFAAAFLAGCP